MPSREQASGDSHIVGGDQRSVDVLGHEAPLVDMPQQGHTVHGRQGFAGEAG